MVWLFWHPWTHYIHDATNNSVCTQYHWLSNIRSTIQAHFIHDAWVPINSLHNTTLVSTPQALYSHTKNETTNKLIHMIGRSLHDLTTYANTTWWAPQQGQNLKEENHLLSWGMVILTPSSILPLQPREHDRKMGEERPPTVRLPYIAGVSEWIRRVCKDYSSVQVRAFFFFFFLEPVTTLTFPLKRG